MNGFRSSETHVTTGGVLIVTYVAVKDKNEELQVTLPQNRFLSYGQRVGFMELQKG